MLWRRPPPFLFFPSVAFHTSQLFTGLFVVCWWPGPRHMSPCVCVCRNECHFTHTQTEVALTSIACLLSLGKLYHMPPQPSHELTETTRAPSQRADTFPCYSCLVCFFFPYPFHLHVADLRTAERPSLRPVSNVHLTRQNSDKEPEVGVMLHFGLRELFRAAGPHDTTKSRGLVGKTDGARNTKERSISVFSFVAAHAR